MSAYAQVPAVALLANPVSNEAVLAAGFDGLLVKPFTHKQLLHAIDLAQAHRMAASY
jgi:CheY-like chemotaxis protein